MIGYWRPRHHQTLAGTGSRWSNPYLYIVYLCCWRERKKDRKREIWRKKEKGNFLFKSVIYSIFFFYSFDWFYFFFVLMIFTCRSCCIFLFSRCLCFCWWWVTPLEIIFEKICPVYEKGWYFVVSTYWYVFLLFLLLPLVYVQCNSFLCCLWHLLVFCCLLSTLVSLLLFAGLLSYLIAL
jgi:hypothetical protein